ncbi:MAG TPA: sigma-E factor regulatory protein RseB domain-containing protein [Glaciihabitans sp.]|jgi:outer membrane lipoprotein-sorting protein|nr:sigma-E factor regulatory protein RseB domain-containing protein [Glaciihabitans sp.]
MNTKVVRWLPAAVIPSVIVVAALAAPAVADDTPDLEPKTAQELLELVASSETTAFSGTVEQTSDLGLPELPMGAGGDSSTGASAAIELLTSDHTVRVFVGGDDTSRVQVMDTLAQRDVIRNGSEVWFYDSEANEATKVTVPEKSATPEASPYESLTPAQMAQSFLEKVDPSTEITVGDTARVAGRDAYTLTLSPDTSETLIGSVVLTVDAETGMPLATSVTARDQASPAFSVAFSSIDFTAPDASLFEFTPPAGATVTEKTEADLPEHSEADATVPGDHPRPTVVGADWASILILPAEMGAAGEMGAPGDAPSGSSPEGADATALLEQMTTAVPEGRILSTSLVTILLANDGRVLVGAVSAEQLQTAAQTAQ